MKNLYVVSDLHLEHFPFFLDQEAISVADAIILAGDICDPTKLNSWLVKNEIPFNKPIFYVFGNHEYYGHSLYRNGFGKNLVTNYGMVGGKCVPNLNLFTDRDYSFVVGDTKIVGCTLWTNYRGSGLDTVSYNKKQALANMNDYRWISYDGYRTITPDDLEEIHRHDVEKIMTGFVGWKGKKVVVTHHLPSLKCIDAKYRGSILNPAFASDLEDLIVESDADVWIYGHTHSSADFYIGKCRMICNPRGYASALRNENAGFNPKLIVRV